MNYIEMRQKRIAEIEDNLKMLDEMIKKSANAEDAKPYSTKYDALLMEKGRVSLEIEIEEKRIADETNAQRKAETPAVKAFGTEPKIVVGTPSDYKGFNLKREMEHLKDRMTRKTGWMSDESKDRLKSEANVELITKIGADLLIKAGYDPRTGEFSGKSRREVDAEMKAVVAEGTSVATGSGLVPTEEENELYYYMRDTSKALQFATVVPMNSDTKTLNGELAKVDVTFGAETEAIAETEPTFEQTTLTARKATGYSLVTNEFIEDTFLTGGIIGVLLPQFLEAMGQKIDSVVFVGTGADSALFSGIMLGRTGIYSEVFSTGSSNFSELLYADVTGILSQVPELYIGGNGRWYMNQVVLYNYFANVKDTTGNPLFLETRGGGGVPRRILGYPVELVTKCWSTTAASRAMCIFGDLSGVYLGRRIASTSLVVDPYTAINNDETKFYFRQRWAFAVPLPSKLGRIVTAA